MGDFMTYIEDICKTFNFTYLDFLETNLFQTKLEQAKKNCAISQILAEGEDDKEKIGFRSDISEPNNPFNTKPFEFPNIDFKDSFYLGHFELKSLLDTEQGKNVIFKILEHRANKLKKLKKLFDEVTNELEKEGRDAIEFNNSFVDIYKQKYILDFNHYLADYEKYKEYKQDTKYTQFYNTYKADKESFINFVLANSTTSQTFIKKN